MATIGTRADSMNFFLTGAASDGGAQTSPVLALGNYRSSSEESPLGWTVASAISNVSILYVAGNNGVGTGTLTAASSSTLTWTPPGGSAGPAVSCAPGASVMLEGSDPSKYIRVQCTATGSFTGAATLTLVDVMNNVVGGPNVTSAQATSGEDTYLGLMMKNVNPSVNVSGLALWIGTLGTEQTSNSTQLGSSGSGTITTTGSFSDWPASGFCRVQSSGGTLKEIVYYSANSGTALTVPSAGRAQLGTSATAGANTDLVDSVPGIAIGTEATSSNHIQTITNINTAPSGITFYTPITQGTGVAVGTVNSGTMVGLWIWRHITAGSVAQPSVLDLIQRNFDAA